MEVLMMEMLMMEILEMNVQMMEMLPMEILMLKRIQTVFHIALILVERLSMHQLVQANDHPDVSCLSEPAKLSDYHKSPTLVATSSINHCDEDQYPQKDMVEDWGISHLRDSESSNAGFADDEYSDDGSGDDGNCDAKEPGAL